jgi:hypothetical protein
MKERGRRKEGYLKEGGRRDKETTQALTSPKICQCTNSSEKCTKCPMGFQCDGCTCVNQNNELRIPLVDDKDLPFPLPDPLSYDDTWRHTLNCHLVVTGQKEIEGRKCSSDPSKLLYLAHCLRNIIPVWRMARAMDQVSYRTCMVLFPQASYYPPSGVPREYVAEFTYRNPGMGAPYTGQRSPYEPFLRSGLGNPSASPFRDFIEAEGQPVDLKPPSLKSSWDKIARKNFRELVFKDILQQASPAERKYLAKWSRMDVQQIAAMGLTCLVGIDDIPLVF